MERVVSGWDHDATNIPLRWSGLFLVGITMLRTYRSDGAEKIKCSFIATDIPLRWGGVFLFGIMMLRTYRSHGAARYWLGLLCYEHIAPMERLVSDWDHDATNIPLPWSGKN